jgi:hypothetical protein
MARFTFSLDGSRDVGQTLCCRGVDANGAEAVMQGRSRDVTDQALVQITSDVLRRGLALKQTNCPLAFEYDTVTERQIPVMYCYRPDTVKAPVVFFNHGTGGTGVEQLFMGVPMAERGFFVVLLDARYHGRRRSPNFSELFSGRLYKETYVTMLVGTCQDISRLLDHLADDPRADVERAAVSGISQGGFVSFMAVTMDKRLKAATPIIGSPDLEDRFGSSQPLEDHSREVIDLVVRSSPLRNYRRIPPTALLVQNGAADETVPVAGVRKLDEKLRELYRQMPDLYQYIEYPGVGHSDQGMREPSIQWLVKHLRPTPPPESQWAVPGRRQKPNWEPRLD